MCNKCIEFTGRSTSVHGPRDGDFHWAAGLMAGDGCFTNNPRPNGDPYFIVACSMRDKRAVTRLGQAFADIAADYRDAGSTRNRVKNIRAHEQPHAKGGVFWRLWIGGPRAVFIGQRLLPYMGDNDRTDQLIAALASVGAHTGGQ